MRVNLVYCPFVDPVTPPLGIASLKAAIEQSSNIVVRCIDLNLVWHHRLVAEVQEAQQRAPLPPELERFLAAARVLASTDGEFFELERYNRASVEFLELTRRLHLSSIKQLEERRPRAHATVAEFVDAALEGEPDVVGLSILFDEQVAFSLALAAELEARRPELVIVFGGAALDSSLERVMASSQVDFAIRDSGETALLELLVSLEEGTVDRAIPGLVYRDGARLVRNPVRRANMDAHPFPDFSDHELSRYFTPEIVIPVLTQKGCYWAKCSFCAEGSLNVYAKASIGRVVDEIAHHARAGHRYFHFVDEMIAAKRFQELSEEILRRGLEVYFYAYLRPGIDYTQHALDAMYRAGCRYVVWGLESANPRVLELVNKGTTVESIRTTFDRASRAGIRNHAFVMVGFPTETPAELFETMQFIYDHADDLHHTHRSFYCLLEGTDIYDRPARYGITLERDEDGKLVRVTYAPGTTTANGEALLAYYYDTFLKELEIAPAFGVFRDHALLHYARFDLAVHQRLRRPVPPPTLPLALLCDGGTARASVLENPLRNHAEPDHSRSR